jgi:hypothetical protein
MAAGLRGQCARPSGTQALGESAEERSSSRLHRWLKSRGRSQRPVNASSTFGGRSLSDTPQPFRDRRWQRAICKAGPARQEGMVFRHSGARVPPSNPCLTRDRAFATHLNNLLQNEERIDEGHGRNLGAFILFFYRKLHRTLQTRRSSGLKALQRAGIASNTGLTRPPVVSSHRELPR